MEIPDTKNRSFDSSPHSAFQLLTPEQIFDSKRKRRSSAPKNPFAKLISPPANKKKKVYHNVATDLQPSNQASSSDLKFKSRSRSSSQDTKKRNLGLSEDLQKILFEAIEDHGGLNKVSVSYICNKSPSILGAPGTLRRKQVQNKYNWAKRLSPEAYQIYLDQILDQRNKKDIWNSYRDTTSSDCSIDESSDEENYDNVTQEEEDLEGVESSNKEEEISNSYLRISIGEQSMNMAAITKNRDNGGLAEHGKTIL